MKTLILDGSRAGDPMGGRVAAALKAELQSRGRDVEHMFLREQKIGNCAGDFFCWIRTPGQCHLDDDNRRIARAVAGCDLLVYLTPVTFGGYSSELKRAVDHLTQNNLPFFGRTGGELHHPPRYAHVPKLLAIGWQEAPNADEAAVFNQLVWRNAINMHYPASVSGVVVSGEPDAALARAVRAWVEDVETGRSLEPRPLPPPPEARLAERPVRRAVLLVGSPRGPKSTSYALVTYLAEQLRARGIQAEVVPLYPALGSGERMRSLLEAVDASDLTLLACPLYIDSLPGPVMRALEQIAAHRAGRADGTAFAAIVNCGFPEAKQNRTALAICAAFARRAGFAWAGGLAMGAGAAVVNGTPLAKLGWRGDSLRRALQAAAGDLAAGRPFSEEAVALMAKQRVPVIFVIALGAVGWMLQARRYHALFSLRRQPYVAGR